MVGTLSGFLDMRIQSASCQSWYFVWDFGYEDTELLLDFWIQRSRAHPANVGTLSRNFGYEDGCKANPAKVGTLSGFLDTKIKSSSCQSGYFIWDFGYDDAESTLTKLVLCHGFWI